MNSDERYIRRTIRQLEAFAKRVTTKSVLADGIEGYLDLQEEILNLQMSVQRRIGEVKARKSKESAVITHLAHLRRLRWLSRRAGDAVAWNALLLDRQVIHSLDNNSLVPVPSSWSDGHRGVFQLARSLTSREWGIPIVHDITSALRIGDVTFVQPALHPQKAAYRTMELKTSRVREYVNEDGETVAILNVAAVATEPLPHTPLPTEAASTPHADNAAAFRRRPDRRIARQVERMHTATAAKNAPSHAFTKVGNENVFTVRIEDETQPHWKELRRAIRQARREGFAYFELGGFVGYSIIYNRDGVNGEDIEAAPVIEHVNELMHDATSSRNSITVSHLPDRDDDRYSSRVLPLYLWEVPHRAICDILRGRLLITATYNTGWMEQLLRDAGLVVNVPKHSGKDKRDFEVITEFPWDMAVGEYHQRAPWEDMYVAVHEFRGPDVVVQRMLMPSIIPQHVTFEQLLAVGDPEPPQ